MGRRKFYKLNRTIIASCLNENDDCIFFSRFFAFFSNSSAFSAHLSPIFPILSCSERVLYVHKYALSGCTNVPTNRPIPTGPYLTLGVQLREGGVRLQRCASGVRAA